MSRVLSTIGIGSNELEVDAPEQSTVDTSRATVSASNYEDGLILGSGPFPESLMALSQSW